MPGFLETIFQFLFKYRPLVFGRGTFRFAAPQGAVIIALLVFIAAFLTLYTLTWVRQQSGRRDRIVLFVLRSATLLILLFCFLQPVLVVSTTVPQENALGILIDDSLSMRLNDYGGRPRSAFVEEQFGPEEGPLLESLSDQFKLRFFSFSSGTRRLHDLSELGYSGEKTHLGQALERARQELAAVPLSGLVVLTDGAENGDEPLTEPLLALRSSSIPVYTVGIGESRFRRDVELVRVESPRSVLRGTTTSAEVIVSQHGYGGNEVDLVIEESGRIVKTQQIKLPGEGQTASIPVHFPTDNPGAHTYRFHIATQQGELIEQNNALETLIQVEDDREKILYLEGEPRFEFKFLRRAVVDDENLHLISVQQTAENKVIRMDLEDPDDLLGGFPTTREELYEYKGLILGSVKADFFTSDQLQMITDFVNRRGGGLIMLGGRWSFGEGGYAGTPVEDVLPVLLDEGSGDNYDRYLAELKVEPTPYGRSHAVTRLADTEEETLEKWRALPPLTSVNRVFRTKPGATTLLSGRVQDGPGTGVVLAFQRYGRGKSIAMPVQDTWMWQMHADIPLEDQTHETLWRQLLRWLVSNVPTQVSVTATPEKPSPGEEVTLVAEVTDESFLYVNDTEVMAYVTDPAGETTTVPLEWTVEEDGEYTGRFVPSDDGRYEVRVDAFEEGELLGTRTSYLDAAAPTDEYFGAQMRRPLLERIANETGGRFYTTETVEQLPEDIQYTESGTTVLEENDLWDMPVILLLIIGLVSTEWFYRRFKGLK